MFFGHAARRLAFTLARPLALGACADPLLGLDRLSEVSLPEDANAAALAPPSAEQSAAPGFLSRVLDRTLGQGPGLLPASVDSSGEAGTPEPGPDDDNAAADGTDAPLDLEDAPPEDEVAGVPARRGFVAFLSRLAPSPASARNATPGEAGDLAGSSLDLAQDEVAVVCSISARSLGTVVGQASGYTIHDSNTASVVPRPHYVTGFSDGCARRFRAALILFGDVGTHEVIRYSEGTEDLPFTATDTAYEDIKRRVCGVGRGQPCGAALDRLAVTTTFLTVYETFGTNAEWAKVLLSGGELIAIASKGS